MNDELTWLINEARKTQGYSEGDLRSLIRSFVNALESLPVTPEPTEVTDEMVERAYRGWRTAQSGGPLRPGEYEATFSRVEFEWLGAALSAALAVPVSPTEKSE